jgi:hypothetical protein
MSDSKVSALTAAPTPLDEDWLLKLSKGTPDNLDRRATLAQVRGGAGPGLQRMGDDLRLLAPFGDHRAAVVEDDFMGLPLTHFLTATGGSGAGASILSNNALGHTGVLDLQTGTTATGNACVQWPAGNPAANYNLWFGDGAWIIEARLRLQALSDGSQTFAVRFGFTPDPANPTPPNCGLLVYDPATYSDGNWRCLSRNSNTERVVNSGVAASASVWQTLRIEVAADGSFIRSFIDGTQVDENTTNVPTGSGKRMGYGLGIRKSVGTTARSLYVDRVLVVGDFSGGRPA